MSTDVDPRIEAEEEEAEAWAHETPEAHEVDYGRIRRKGWLIQREGKDFILFAGLIDLLHQESRGQFTISTRLEQAPSAENGQTAIVSATVSMGGVESGVDHRCAAGIGDANAGNVTRMMAPHAIRMAETRAKARALRDLLNVGYVAAEELGPDGPAKDARYEEEQKIFDRATQRFAGGTAEGPDTITVDGRPYTRDQIYGFYQQRVAQCRDRSLPIPQPMLNRNVNLQTIVDQTQALKRTLAENGALAPATNGARP